MGGGAAARHFGKRCLNPSHFHARATNSISYESWDIQLKFDILLRLLRLKLRPREVAEVARVQAHKNWSKILKSAIFELHKRYIPQKKAENNHYSDLKWNYRILLWKSWKKINFVIFDPKKSWPRLGLGWISEKRAKIVKKFLDFIHKHPKYKVVKYFFYYRGTFFRNSAETEPRSWFFGIENYKIDFFSTFS